MTEAFLLLREFADRLSQVHLSEVSSSNRHNRLSLGAVWAFRAVSQFIPEHVPVILETPVPPGEIRKELNRAGEALPLPQYASAT